jgi:hypothetical protein
MQLPSTLCKQDHPPFDIGHRVRSRLLIHLDHILGKFGMPFKSTERSKELHNPRSTMLDPLSTSEVKAEVGAVEASMEDATTKMDVEKTTEVPRGSEKAAEKTVEGPVPIKPAGETTSSVEATDVTSSAAIQDSKDALATYPLLRLSPSRQLQPRQSCLHPLRRALLAKPP